MRYLAAFCWQFVTLALLVETSIANGEDLTDMRIGLLTELTGPGAAGSGMYCRRGYELAEKTLLSDGRLEGRRFRLFYRDSHGEGRPAVTEFKSLVNIEKVHAIVTNRSPVGMALNPLSRKAKVPLIGIVGHNDFLAGNPYSFRVWPSTGLEAEALAKAAYEQGIRSVAIVSVEDEWNLSLRKEFVREFTRLGGTIGYDYTVLVDHFDFATGITKLKSNPVDAVFINLGPSQTPTFIAKLAELRVGKQLLGNSYAANPEVVEKAGTETVEGLMLAEARMDSSAIKQALRENFGNELINQHTYTCYAGVKLLLAAFKAQPDISSSEMLYERLKQIKSLNLFGDDIPLANRELQFPLAIKAYRKGILTELRPRK